ncbi:MAG TPA: hypothetical protein VHM64_06995 [Candidatus Binatia bacterium]|nr:hypothetical protein [Candidatus Binatia bacterium]
MPNRTEEYSGYTIIWDTSSVPETELWKVKAGVVPPLDSSGVPSTIHGIAGDRFESEAKARNYVLQAAKKWVDERLAAHFQPAEGCL